MNELNFMVELGGDGIRKTRTGQGERWQCKKEKIEIVIVRHLSSKDEKT